MVHQDVERPTSSTPLGWASRSNIHRCVCYTCLHTFSPYSTPMLCAKTRSMNSFDFIKPLIRWFLTMCRNFQARERPKTRSSTFSIICNVTTSRLSFQQTVLPSPFKIWRIDCSLVSSGVCRLKLRSPRRTCVSTFSLPKWKKKDWTSLPTCSSSFPKISMTVCATLKESSTHSWHTPLSITATSIWHWFVKSCHGS